MLALIDSSTSGITVDGTTFATLSEYFQSIDANCDLE